MDAFPQGSDLVLAMEYMPTDLGEVGLREALLCTHLTTILTPKIEVSDSGHLRPGKIKALPGVSYNLPI